MVSLPRRSGGGTVVADIVGALSALTSSNAHAARLPSRLRVPDIRVAEWTHSCSCAYTPNGLALFGSSSKRSNQGYPLKLIHPTLLPLKQSAMGTAGYAGLVNLGQLPIK